MEWNEREEQERNEEREALKIVKGIAARSRSRRSSGQRRTLDWIS